MFSRFFITRPIFACVISAFIVIAGVAAFTQLPVSEQPEILPPQVTVSASYPGASAETIASTVAAPLEQQINGVEHMLYMSSVSSADGNLNLTLTFETGTDADLAAINVNNRVQSAVSRLPEEVRRQGVVVSKTTSTLLSVITLQSPDKRFDELFISNYADLNVVDELKRIPGVGGATNFASMSYSMRIWLDPGKLAKLGLTPSDIAKAVREQNSQYTAGAVGDEPLSSPVDFRLAVTADGRYSSPEQFENIIVSTSKAAVVRLKDVARVELGAQRYDFSSRFNGQPAIPVGITLLSGANALDVSKAIDQRMTELSRAFPEGLQYSIPYDTAKYVRLSIREVLITLGEAMVLVFLVVLLFLQRLRATLIPMLAVPVSLIGTLAAMYVFGFSINTLTLFGIVLAIGIVVDDAIVVLENVERIMSEENLSAPMATDKAMQQVTRPVVAIVLVLCSVFTPIAFLGGLVGEMYRQFAVTIAISVAISGFVALTLTPALCALLLHHEDSVQHGVFAWFQTWFANVTARYSRGVAYFLKHSILVGLVLAASIVAMLGLYRSLPTALAPAEDRGYVIAISILPDGASLSRTRAVTKQLNDTIASNAAVGDVFSFDGYDPINNALRANVSTVWVVLKDWSERKAADLSPSAVVGSIYQAAGAIKDGLVLAFEPAPISGISNTGGFDAYVQSRSSTDPAALEAATQKLVAAAAKRKELAGVSTTFTASSPQLRVDVDREKAKLLGVNLDEVFTALKSTFGTYYINDFNREGRVFQVQMQAEAKYRSRAEDIREVYVRSAAGNLLPLTSIVSLREVTGPEIVQRFNVFPAASINGNPGNGYSSGDAIKALEAVAAESLPEGYTLAWSGAYLQEKLSGGASTGMLLLGMLMVFLILAAQYERWSLPVAVLLAVPFAMLGAMLAVWARGLLNDVFFQIGLVTLVGLSAKNAILIVEFAMMKTAEGYSLHEAAITAARQRFRPIIMTSMAFIFGVIPLAISSGAGAGSRHSIGTGVIGGMLLATLVGTLFIPAFYVWAARLGKLGRTGNHETHDKPDTTT